MAGTYWTERATLKLQVRKPFTKYVIATSTSATTKGGVILGEPNIQFEKYDVGRITLTRLEERDPETSWPMFVGSGKRLPISGYEVHGLLVEKFVKIVG